MATAIIKGLMAQNDGKADFINVFDVSEEKCAAMKNMGANVMTSADEIAKNSSIVVLAVKPQNYPEVLESPKQHYNSQNRSINCRRHIYCICKKRS